MHPEILFLDHTSELGGAELYLQDVAREYREHSRVVLFEEGPFANRLRRDGVSVTVVQAPSRVLSVRRNAGLGSILRAIPGLITLTTTLVQLARSADLVVANSQKSMLVGGFATALAGRPFVWILHDILTADHFSPLLRRLAVIGANMWTNQIIVNSAATREALAEAGGPAQRSHVVPNGLDPGRFDNVSKDEVAALRSSLGVQESPVVGMFSRLAPWKGQHILIEALASLPSTHALFVGDALFDGDRSYANTLRRCAKKYHVADRVHFLGFRDDIPTLMKACDVVVHASTAPEPFGRVIVEAMLASRPVVATEAGGAAEIVEDGQTGCLVPPGDVQALRQTLDALIDNSERRRRLAVNGRKEAVRRFSTSEMLRAIHAVFHEAL